MMTDVASNLRHASLEFPAMKNILVPVEQHTLMQSVMDTAVLLARRFEAYVEGFAIGPDIPDVVPVDVVIGVPSILDQKTRQEMATASRRLFESAMQAHGVPRDVAGGPRPSYGWSEAELKGDSFVGSYGRVFDVTVVGRPSSHTDHPRMVTLEAALFESGRPILVAPPSPPPTLGETIVIAWNGSTETTRAMAFAAPLLRRAKRVVVTSAEVGMVQGPSGEQVARYLRNCGIEADTMNVPGSGRSAGEAFLANAAAVGCDLLIKGAYTQSRLRQMIFGGATSHILSATTVPVFMAH
jgi:nucleotide-binding universal stress UspA family protein